VERYLRAAETILQQAYPATPTPSTVKRQTAAAPDRWLIYPSRLHGGIHAPAPGLYRIRVQLSALPSFKGRLPRLSLWNNSLKRAEVGQDILASEDQPTVVEFQTFLPQGGFQLINEAPGKRASSDWSATTPSRINFSQRIANAISRAMRGIRPAGTSRATPSRYCFWPNFLRLT